MYDHKRKIAWWMNARLVLELVVLPVMIVTTAAAFFFGRSDFEDTTALVTFAEIVCEAKKTHLGRTRTGLFETERIVLPCSSFKTSLGEGLQEQGYVLAKTSQIKVRFRSPADNRLHEASAQLRSTDVSVGDRIRIGASKEDVRSIRAD